MSAYSIATRGLAGRKVPQGVLATMDELLFGSGEQGAWYDPSDLSTLFQDTAGTTPVTAVEQAVALVLDKSGRGNHASQATSTKRPKYSRRVNLITGSEATGGSGGTPGTAPDGWVNHYYSGSYAHTIDSGKHRFAQLTAGSATIKTVINWAPGVTYVVTVNVINNASSATVANFVYLGLQAGTSGLAYQTYVDGVATTTVPSGAHEIEIICSYTSGAPTNYLFFGSGTSASAICDVTLIDASVTLATDAHLPYQWVNTATDYDADPNKFPAYLACDGIDDAMQTGNIDFTGTDKMTVWAGVNNPGLTNQWVVSIGLFQLFMNSYGFDQVRSHGTSSVYAGSTPPKFGKCALTGIGDISAPKAEIRVDGVSRAVSTTSQGTGNYTNAMMNFGVNGGYYSGIKLYSLIVRGAQSTLSQIEATELYVKQKMRLP